MKPRILLIEDSPERIVTFRRWLEGTGFVLIEASSGGRARGILRKGMTEGIAGLCLDHDLDQQPVTPTDFLSTSGLMASIILSIPRTTPVLIHSMNAQKPPGMERQLNSEGFSVTRCRMAALTQERFNEWLEEVRDIWETTQEKSG
jgi:CheY-like chemotaxis protein